MGAADVTDPAGASVVTVEPVEGDASFEAPQATSDTTAMAAVADLSMRGAVTDHGEGDERCRAYIYLSDTLPVMNRRRNQATTTPPRDRSRVAILGALSVEPMTGYELRRNIDATLGHFWRESYGQIYPSLASLEAEGLVAAEPTEREGSRRYRITVTGRRRLRAWLDRLGPPSPPRHPLLLQVFFGRQLGAERVAELVRAERARAEQSLATLTAIEAEVRIERGYEHDRPYWLLTIDHGRRSAEAVMAWADAALVALAAEQHR